MYSLEYYDGDELGEAEQAGLAALNRQVDECRRCAERGYVAIPRPIDRGQGQGRVWLIGQAPGYGEGERKLAFGGPAGRTLMKWLGQAGLSEERVRELFFLSAINKCYPGRATGGGGDRLPVPLERALCRPYLLQELVLLRPKLAILVGSTAIKEVYGDKIRLEEIIGQRRTMPAGELYQRLLVRYARTTEAHQYGDEIRQPWFDQARPVEIHHLPHPSGASTWLNLPRNRALLEQALDQLKITLMNLNLT